MDNTLLQIDIAPEQLKAARAALQRAHLHFSRIESALVGNNPCIVLALAHAVLGARAADEARTAAEVLHG
ncbi:hypothetical protein QCE73_00225 [Caballeronia sp. LZ029]|uniref:hypothetical protein n=1 Tax=Caballeronia sp. LZ029 TaxID=3038564 RepID=UPI0028609F0F|nr:hypothetical protein [Caballeronia sp. LZ029]MDR5741573.1 hypothetical protein [Caballeronia sp. LZ029]